MPTFLHNHNYFYESQKVFGKNCNTAGSQKMLTRAITTWQLIEHSKTSKYSLFTISNYFVENEFFYSGTVSNILYPS